MLAQIEFRQGMEDAWATIAEFVPKIALALAVFIVGWVVARLFQKLAHRVLLKLQFNKTAARAGFTEPLTRAGYPDAALLLSKVVFWAVILLVLQVAIGALGETEIQDALDGVVAFLPKFFAALLIVVVAGAIATRVREAVSRAEAAQAYGPMLGRAAGGAVWFVGIFAALNQIEVAQDIVNILFIAVVATVGLTVVVKFGVGGIKTAQENIWPAIYSRSGSGAGEPAGDESSDG